MSWGKTCMLVFRWVLKSNKEKFALFNLCRFQNKACDAGSNRNGTCYTEQECEDRNGEANGSCAEGFGVCCYCRSYSFAIWSNRYVSILLHVRSRCGLWPDVIWEQHLLCCDRAHCRNLLFRQSLSLQRQHLPGWWSNFLPPHCMKMCLLDLFSVFTWHEWFISVATGLQHFYHSWPRHCPDSSH